MSTTTQPDAQTCVTRMDAIAYMARNGANDVCGTPREGVSCRSLEQQLLTTMLTAIANDPRVPLDVVARLGKVVHLAYRVGKAPLACS